MVLPSLVKTLVTIGVVALFAAILLHPGVGTGRGHGMAAGLPILLGLLGWDAASALTRRTTMWRTSLVVTGVFGIAGTAILGLTALNEGTDFGRRTDATIIVAFGLLLLACAAGAHWSARAFARWPAAERGAAPRMHAGDDGPRGGTILSSRHVPAAGEQPR